MPHQRQRVKYAAKNYKTEDKHSDRLSKRLCYVLRYGALKEGLNVMDGGFVDLKELMDLNIMRHDCEADILKEVEMSVSSRNTRRFECRQFDGRTFIRACFCRNLETNPCHSGTRVTTLKQTCINYVLENLQDYDLEDFPDEATISSMICQLKKKKRLNSESLKALLVPALAHLDLNAVYLTSNILKYVWTQCPNLQVLSLRDCGYIVTDSVVETILRKLPYLTSLNLASCKHITDKSLRSVCMYGKNLQELDLSWIMNITGGGILDLMVNSVKLKFLDIYHHKLSGETRALVIEAARQRGVKIILKGLLETDPDVTLENPSMLQPNFGRTW